MQEGSRGSKGGRKWGRKQRKQASKEGRKEGNQLMNRGRTGGIMFTLLLDNSPS